MVSLIDKDVLSLESKHYYTVPYLPDAISDNKTKFPQRSSAKPANLISATRLFQLIQLTFAGVEAPIMFKVEESVRSKLLSVCAVAHC